MPVCIVAGIFLVGFRSCMMAEGGVECCSQVGVGICAGGALVVLAGDLDALAGACMDVSLSGWGLRGCPAWFRVGCWGGPHCKRLGSGPGQTWRQ